MFRRIAIKILFFQFRIYIYVKTLTKKYLPNSIYQYVFIKSNIRNGGGDSKSFRDDEAVQEISGEKATEGGRCGRKAWDTYESIAPKGETISRRKSFNDLQGMFENGK